MGYLNGLDKSLSEVTLCNRGISKISTWFMTCLDNILASTSNV